MTITIEFAQGINVTDGLKHEIEAYIDGNMGGTDFYTVHTEETQEEAIREYIEQTAWAFNSWFIADHSSEGVTSDVIEVLQEKSEGANEAILQLIEGGSGLDEFVENAVSIDGYGHFLSGYDGVEHEVEVDGETYYIYAN